ncbi:MAG: CoA pyrophosphatase, partial [Phaeodactylibacter sp.]|nr:CoA pyrophosphatase [Phaeodactylibacter sp.]
ADIELIGALTELYIPVSNFLVYPFVGRIDYTPTFRPQEDEVAGILHVPFDEFLKPESLRYKDMHIGSGLRLIDVPYYHIQDRVVWGATAMMLSELLEVMPMDT